MCSRKVLSEFETGSRARFLLTGSLVFFVVVIPLWLWVCFPLFSLLNGGRTDELAGKSDSGRHQPLFEAAKLVMPEKQQMKFSQAGFSSNGGKPDMTQQVSSLEKKKFIDAYKKATSQEVKATILPGFARQQNYQAMPLIIEAVKSPSVVLSGRALATAENLLGIRYKVSMLQLSEQSFRNKISNMVAQDWKKLEAFPRFANGLATP